MTVRCARAMIVTRAFEILSRARGRRTRTREAKRLRDLATRLGDATSRRAMSGLDATTRASERASASRGVVLVRDDDGVRVVTVVNAARGNALTMEMIRDLARAFATASASGASCVILRGCPRSKHFCSGVDLASAEEVFASDEGDVASDPASAMEACEVPIVGCAHGDCVNAGFELMLGCDAVVCAADARFVDTHAKIGILPSWGLSVKLSRAIGSNAARACSVFGEALDASRALELGLVHRVCADAEAAFAAAKELAAKARSFPAGGAAGVKRAINDGLVIADARAEERRRAFENYRLVAKSRFAAFNKARAKL